MTYHADSSSSPADSGEGGRSSVDPPYTTWSVGKRRIVILLLGYLSLASSLTANAYFPLLELLAAQFETSIQSINLTITVAFVFQGVAPAFWSPLSDSFGRRPVYMVTFLIYTAGSLGLVLANQSYAVLLISRALQSIGSASVLSLSYAVVSDICVHSERGHFIAPMMAATNVGPLVGPLMGGGSALVTGSADWCFRTFLIFGGTGMVLVGLSLPESLRTIVGNGSVAPKGIWKTWWRMGLDWTKLRHSPQQPTCLSEVVSNAACEQETADAEPKRRVPDGRGKPMLPNPLLVLRLVFYWDTFLVLWLAASPYAMWFSVQTMITPIMYVKYGLNPFEISLCFLASGSGIIAGGFVAGKLMDANYRHIATRPGLSIDKKKGDNMSNFPIEHARSRWSIRMILATLATMIGYGWAVEFSTHIAVLLILQLCLGLRCTVLHQTYSALIVDVFEEKPGTAAAANNIVRCLLTGILVAALDPIARAVGYGWMYTGIGFVDAVGCIVAIMALRRYGKSDRDHRRQRGEAVGPSHIQTASLRVASTELATVEKDS